MEDYFVIILAFANLFALSTASAGVIFPSSASCTPSSGVDALTNVETKAIKASAAPPKVAVV